MVFHKARAVAVPTSINVGEFALTGTKSETSYSCVLRMTFFLQIVFFHNVVFQLLVLDREKEKLNSKKRENGFKPHQQGSSGLDNATKYVSDL